MNNESASPKTTAIAMSETWDLFWMLVVFIIVSLAFIHLCRYVLAHVEALKGAPDQPRE